MATRVIPPRILRNLRYNTATRPLNAAVTTNHPSLSATVAPPFFLEKPDQKQHPLTAAPHVASETLNFDNSERLFAYVPSTKLLRSTTILHATAFEPMVDLGMWMMTSKFMDVDLLKDLIFSIIRHTFYDHFCAGEDAATAGKSIRSLNDAGLRGMLVYGVEDANDNEGCDRNFRGFLHTIEVSRSLQPSSVSYFQFHFF